MRTIFIPLNTSHFSTLNRIMTKTLKEKSSGSDLKPVPTDIRLTTTSDLDGVTASLKLVYDVASYFGANARQDSCDCVRFLRGSG